MTVKSGSCPKCKKTYYHCTICDKSCSTEGGYKKHANTHGLRSRLLQWWLRNNKNIIFGTVASFLVWLRNNKNIILGALASFAVFMIFGPWVAQDTVPPWVTSVDPPDRAIIFDTTTNIMITLDDAGANVLSHMWDDNSLDLAKSKIEIKNQAGISIKGDTFQHGENGLIFDAKEDLNVGDYEVIVTPKDKFGNGASIRYSQFSVIRGPDTHFSIEEIRQQIGGEISSIYWKDGYMQYDISLEKNLVETVSSVNVEVKIDFPGTIFKIDAIHVDENCQIKTDGLTRIKNETGEYLIDPTEIDVIPEDTTIIAGNNDMIVTCEWGMEKNSLAHQVHVFVDTVGNGDSDDCLMELWWTDNKNNHHGIISGNKGRTFDECKNIQTKEHIYYF